MKKIIISILITILVLIISWVAIIFIPGKTDNVEDYPKEEQPYILDALNMHYSTDHFPSGVRIFKKEIRGICENGILEYEIWFRSYNFMNQVVGKGMTSKNCYGTGSGYRGGIFLYPN